VNDPNNDPFDDESNDRPDGPFGSMFGGMFGGMFGDMFKAFGQEPIHWDTARQIAASTATSGKAEENVDPLIRIELSNMSRIVIPHLHEVTGFGDLAQMGAWEPLPVTAGTWANRTLEDYKPLFIDLATALQPGNTAMFGADPDSAELESSDPFGSLFANITGMIAPMTMGMTIGSMVGLLARRSLGQYDLPLPRPAGREFMIVPRAIDAFAQEWNLEIREVRMWTVVRELVIHQLFDVESIRSAVLDLVRRFIGAFRPDPRAITDKLSSIEVSDPGEVMQSLQRILGDPELLLGAVRSSEQDSIQPELDSLLGLVLGWSDFMTDQVSTRILGHSTRIAEAVRRRRIEGGDETAFVERLLGLHLTRRQVDRGRQFVTGVVERAGIQGLRPIYRDRSSLPTPSELDAPGLWLARLEITGDV
jgi:putative hydrolase